MTNDVFERRVEFSAAWDRRDPDPKKDNGVHGVEIRFLLIGAAGAVQFLLFTGWYLPESETCVGAVAHRPMPANLGYHSPVPRYEGQTPMDGPCAVLGGTCYYDGSSLAADGIFKVLLHEGDAGVWRELEAFYQKYSPFDANCYQS